MSEFREQVYHDFEDVLLNVDEFGRWCSWNGEDLQIVEDARLEVQEFEAQGVNIDKKRIYCRDIDLVAPKVTEIVVLDDENWYVLDVKNPFGYLVISLERCVS
jgi:hypothetical protein